jgi:cytochrome c-type biogenesis protein CcmH/NrfF
MIKTWAWRKLLVFVTSALLCAAAVLPILTASADSQPPDHAHRLGMKVRCMCGGCNDSAGGCYHVGGAFSGPCDTAQAMLKTIDQRLAKGDSDDLIVQSFVQEFGPAVLVEPPHNGFAGLAWWIPALAFVLGLGLVFFVISRWRSRLTPQPALAGAALVGAGGTRAIPQDVLERARAQAARETED